MNKQLTEQEVDAQLRKFFGDTTEEALYSLCFKAKPKNLEQYVLWQGMVKDLLMQLFRWDDLHPEEDE